MGLLVLGLRPRLGSLLLGCRLSLKLTFYFFYGFGVALLRLGVRVGFGPAFIRVSVWVYSFSGFGHPPSLKVGGR